MVGDEAGLVRRLKKKERTEQQYGIKILEENDPNRGVKLQMYRDGKNWIS